MLYAEICPKVRRHNARPGRGECIMPSNLGGHISAYNMDNTILLYESNFLGINIIAEEIFH
jgi:hypothetical protein